MNRPLSQLEKAVWLLEQKVSQNFTIVAHCRGPIEKSSLRQALDILQEKHPPLRCKITGEKEPKFVTDDVPAIPIRIMERDSESKWIEVVESELIESLNMSEGPLVRIVLIKGDDHWDLLATFCHIIGDGTSGLAFLHDLLTILDKINSGETLVPVQSLPELASPFELLKKDLTFKSEFWDLPGRILRSLHKPQKISVDKQVSAEQRITRIALNSIDKSNSKELVAMSKKAGISVHAVVCGALLQVIVAQMKERKEIPEKGAVMIGCMTPVNMRHHFEKPVGDALGCFISDAYHYQLIDDQYTLRKAAENTKRSLLRELKYGRDMKVVDTIGNILKIATTPKEILNVIDGQLPPIVVTNLGRIGLQEEYGAIKLNRVNFGGSINPAASCGIGLAVHTFRGVLNLNFLYLEPTISKSTIENIAENTIHRLLEAIS